MIVKIQNKRSSEWLVVKNYTKAKIDSLHLDLEGTRTEYETAIIRGKIAFAREILKLEQDKKPVEVTTVSYDE